MTTENKPHFPHDCDDCKYVGTVDLAPQYDNDGFFDIYRCGKHGAEMTILRGDADDEPLAIPDAGLAHMLTAALASATNGEEEAGPLLIACGVAVAYGVQPIGGGE